MKKFHQDIWISLVILAFCGFFINESMHLDEGSEVMPLILLSLLAFLGVIILINGIRKTLAATAENPVKPFLTLSNMKIPFTMLALVVLYVIAFNFCGYYIATAVFLIGGMIFLKQKNYFIILAITVGFLAFTYFFLVKQLNVSIDEFGVLGQWIQMTYLAQ